MVSAAHKRRAAADVVRSGLCSVRSACKFLKLHRSSFRYEHRRPDAWRVRLQARVEVLSHKRPRLGYKKLTKILVSEGWRVGRKLIQSLRRELGLKVRHRRPRTRRRGRSTGTLPAKAERANHVWSWDAHPRSH